jgi:cell division protein FtsW (lipid II flippase)
LDVPGGTIQPGEFFKIGFVMFLASWLIRKRKIMEDRAFFAGFIIVVAVTCSIFLFIPDLGTLLVIGTVSLIMFWYAGGKAKYVLFTIVL